MSRRAIPTGSLSRPKPGSNRTGRVAMSRRLRIILKSAAVVALGFLAAMPIAAREPIRLQAPDTPRAHHLSDSTAGRRRHRPPPSTPSVPVAIRSSPAAPRPTPPNTGLAEVLPRAASAGPLERQGQRARSSKTTPACGSPSSEKPPSFGDYDPSSRVAFPNGFSAAVIPSPSDILIGGKGGQGPCPIAPASSAQRQKGIRAYFDAAPANTARSTAAALDRVDQGSL